MRAHFQYCACAARTHFRHTKPRVKKSCIMGTEFTHTRVIGAHFGGMVPRHRYKFTAGKNIEFIRIQHQPASHKISCCQLFPIGIHLTTARRVNIDKAGMFARAPADNLCVGIRGQIHAQGHTIAKIRCICATDQSDCTVQRLHGGVRHAAWPAPQTQLRQARALAYQHGKGTRRNLGIEPAMIAVCNRLEFRRGICNQARKDIQTPGRAFRIGQG